MFVIASDIDGDWAIVASSNIVSEVHAERQCNPSPETTAIRCTQYIRGHSIMFRHFQVPLTGRGAKNSYSVDGAQCWVRASLVQWLWPLRWLGLGPKAAMFQFSLLWWSWELCCCLEMK